MKTKKLVALLLTAAMATSAMSVTAFAAGGGRFHRELKDC